MNQKPGEIKVFKGRYIRERIRHYMTEEPGAVPEELVVPLKEVLERAVFSIFPISPKKMEGGDAVIRRNYAYLFAYLFGDPKLPFSEMTLDQLSPLHWWALYRWSGLKKLVTAFGTRDGWRREVQFCLHRGMAAALYANRNATSLGAYFDKLEEHADGDENSKFMTILDGGPVISATEIPYPMNRGMIVKEVDPAEADAFADSVAARNKGKSAEEILKELGFE